MVLTYHVHTLEPLRQRFTPAGTYHDDIFYARAESLTSSDDTPLQARMCFTVEPSITQFEGFSTRVEDVVVARPGGGEPLTSGFQTLHVVE